LSICGYGERRMNHGGKNVKDQASRPSTSHNSGYAVRVDNRPHPNCPTLRFGQLRIAAKRYTQLVA